VPDPADVDAHPAGASPFGVLDLVGNVWQWTDEYADEHTRSATLGFRCVWAPE
jgi:iron(II)-dependent oxidoreductase